ncbi:MAG: ROK family protein [Candidatus Sungbacteria bacterium]|nr:ROK family protein [Candidatus Sungbacteria bacterium]
MAVARLNKRYRIKYNIMHHHALAIDLGATNVRVALVSRSGKVIAKIKDKTPKHGKNGAVISQRIIEMIGLVMAKHPDARPAGIGISSMGPLDYQRGGPLHSPNIPFTFVPLVEPLRRKFSLPVFLLNDANAAVLGEQRFGAGKKKKNLVYITISTGIGGGAIVDGNLLLGGSGNAAEVGHMIVDTTHNIRCSCKKGIGHWEGCASGRNIPKFFKTWAKAHGKKIAVMPATAKDVFDHARSGNAAARGFLDALHRVNARAISNVIVAYDPELITIGGSVVFMNAPVLLSGIKKYVDRHLKTPEIRVSRLGDDIALLGAAAAAFAQNK